MQNAFRDIAPSEKTPRVKRKWGGNAHSAVGVSDNCDLPVPSNKRIKRPSLQITIHDRVTHGRIITWSQGKDYGKIISMRRSNYLEFSRFEFQKASRLTARPLRKRWWERRQ